MKKSLILFISLAFILLSSQPAFCQSITNDDEKAALRISNAIIQLARGIENNFADIKGDSVTKTDDGTMVYQVKGNEEMLTSSQFIMIKSSGRAFYLGMYTDDTKKLAFSLGAFTAGIAVVTDNDKRLTVEQDKEKSTGEQLVYFMLVSGTKVASYTINAKKSEGTIIIGLL